jgi:hypothetical protein
VSHDCGAAMQLGDRTQVDGEGEFDLLSLAQSQFVVSTNTPVADRLMARQSFLRPVGVVIYTVVLARCLVCNLRSTD